MSTQLKAAAKRAPRSRHRGEQKEPRETIKKADGSYTKTKTQKKLYAATRKIKASNVTIARQAEDLAQAQARADELVEMEKNRKRQHTAEGAKFSTKNLVITQVSRWLSGGAG
ncbi:hypothetical protein B484DRAFT_402511 [Ochromonadaceae sp. CCMP2298]|nr:hypothetical protein B484DRAFT_402511 [Ochromonadaceae sp. CCMP2298]